MTVFIKRMRQKGPAVPAQLDLVHHGHYFYIRLTTQDGIDLGLAGTDLELVAELEPIIDQIRNWLGNDRLDKLEEIRGNGHGIIQPGQTLPEYQPESFSRSGRTIDPEAPLEIRAHRYDWIKMNRLTGNPDIDLGLIGLRFPWLAREIDNRVIEQARQYLNNGQAEPAPAIDQLSQDLARIRPYIGDLLDSQGRRIRGAQTRIAEILDLPNTGGAYRRRILAILEAIEYQALKAA